MEPRKEPLPARRLIVVTKSHLTSQHTLSRSHGIAPAVSAHGYIGVIATISTHTRAQNANMNTAAKKSSLVI